MQKKKLEFNQCILSETDKAAVFWMYLTSCWQESSGSKGGDLNQASWSLNSANMLLIVALQTLQMVIHNNRGITNQNIESQAQRVSPSLPASDLAPAIFLSSSPKLPAH